MRDKMSSGNAVVDALLEDEVVNADEVTKEDLEAVNKWWRWSRSYMGSDSTTFVKLDRFKRVYGMLKD